MNRRTLVYLSMAALAACSAGDNTSPNPLPTFKISDGAHRTANNDLNGNVDFFFLPPMVPNPANNPNFNAGDFNPNLIPTVEVCALDLLDNAPASAVLLTTPCKPGGYFVTLGAPVNVGLELYQASWTIPVSSERFYRIFVKICGASSCLGGFQLGFADVWTVSSPSQLKTVKPKDEFVGQQDGSVLPVKFRIEIGALCDPPGTRPCNSSTLALGTGGTIEIEDGSFELPAQNTQTSQHTFTLQKCDDFNPTHVDLPMFGSCLRVKPIPALGGDFDTPATVEVCDLLPDIPAGMTEEQERRITLHRLKSDNTVEALPHVAGCDIHVGATTPSIKGVIKELARGHLRSAVGKLAALLGPKPLYARRINLGGGGQTPGTSDFQFLLPADMEEVEGNGQTGTLGDLLPVQPKIRVVDLGGECVAGVTVNIVGDGVSQTSQTTACPGGEVTVPWTPTLWGTNTLTFSGRGVAGNDLNGPRDHLVVPDPFQPFPYTGPCSAPPSPCVPPTPESGTDSGPILLQTGSLVFNAYGAEGFETSTANAWTPGGFWHKSGVGSSIVNAAFTDGLVSLATGDVSGGAMPNPFAGSNVFWYGNETTGGADDVGNYLGQRANSTPGSGGTSMAANSGSLTSPPIVVPANGQLTFQGWFEIESVDANVFDLMTVSVVPSGGPPVVLGQLNPTTDPNGPADVPFTSAGFNTPPVWVAFTHDLSAYAGQTVSLRFDFNTIDVLYNGFRGWLLDNILVAPPPVLSLRAALRAGNTAGFLNAPQPRRPRNQ